MRGAVLATVLALVAPASALHAAQTTQYTYDALGRVISAIDGNGKKVVYSYDSAGNRTRVSNGAELTEIIPTALSASSNAGTTGLTASNGMRDGNFTDVASIHATQSEANAWIMADLGSAKSVNHIDVAPAVSGSVGASMVDLNDTAVEFSTDGAKWSVAATINGVTPGATRTIAVGGVTLRYLRIHRVLAGRVSLGDLRLYSAAVANSPLVAQPDSITSSGAAVTFDPRINDQDLDGYAFSISTVDDPPHGTAVVNGGTSITYTPDPGYFGADSFLYSVADGHNGTASARVTALVRPSTNHAPVAVNDTMTVSDRVTALVDGINSLRPSANDYDVDGDVLTITAKTDPAHGAVAVVGGNVIEYQPTVSYTGSDSFTYTISDGRGQTATGTVTLTLANSNPVAGADNVVTSRSGAVTFDPRLNDRDPNGDTITVGSVSAPAQGIAALNADQTITYTANPGSIGSDGFTYALYDGRGGSATGSVAVAIALNRAPTASSDSITANASPVTFDPRANDADPDADPLLVVGASMPSHGTILIAVTGTSITYAPASGYTGDDSFTYTISDSDGATATATVAVNGLYIDYLVVGGGGGGGTAGGGGGGVKQGSAAWALGFSATATIGASGSKSGDYNSAGGNGGASTFATITSVGGGGGGGMNSNAGNGGSGGGGGHGNLAGGSGTAGQGFAGSAAMAGGNSAFGGGGGAGGPGATSYTDGTHGHSGSGGPGINSSISGYTDNYAAGGGGFGPNYTDPHPEDGDDSYAIEPGAGGGSSGSTGATYSSWWGPIWASPALANHGGGGGGGGGGQSSAGGSGVVVVRYPGGPKATGGVITQVGGYTIHTFTAGGTFTVTAANAAPTAVNDNISTPPLTAVTFDPRSNDIDTDPLSIVALTAPAHGTAVIANAGQAITYTPTSAYTGSDSFSYTISDSQGGSATAIVSITVAGVSRIFTVSPAVSGKTTWNLDVDGPLNLGAAGTWTITPQVGFTASAKIWGAGGGGSFSRGGAGGYASGTIQFQSGVAYRLDVGGGGGGRTSPTGGAPGGGTATSDPYAGGGGGGFTGVRKTSGPAILIAGGGGGSGWGGAGGAGGGLAGESGGAWGTSAAGGGGTQTTGAGQFVGGASGQYAGGGGGGYYGGGAGQYAAGTGGAGGGGGGSGYADSTDVNSGVLTAGTGTTPGNAGDASRGSAGDVDSASASGSGGKLILSSP